MTQVLRHDLDAGSSGDVPGLPPRQVVCIIGMHRSGTSMVTRLVNAVGVELGAHQDLMDSHPIDNPTGYWEHQAVVDLNDRLLESFGGSWDEPPVLGDGWEESWDLQPMRDQAREILADLAGCGDAIGWKDPRMSLLLPFWNTVLPITATVMVHRHPFQVAASLARRDGIDVEHGATSGLATRWLRGVLIRIGPSSHTSTRWPNRRLRPSTSQHFSTGRLLTKKRWLRSSRLSIPR